MSDYWKQHYDEAVLRNPSSPFKQIGKTIKGVEIQTSQIDLIVAHIAESLALTKKDRLVDLGCGNGVLTVRLAKKISSVVGIDFTRGLLEYAENNFSAHNITYLFSNITELDCVSRIDATKLCMFEVLQHLNEIEFSRLLANLANLPSGVLFFIGGVPDKQRLRNFYDTDEKYTYFANCEREGRPHLGQWWFASTIEDISNDYGWSMNELSQPQGLYTEYYRFDAVLVKR